MNLDNENKNKTSPLSGETQDFSEFFETESLTEEPFPTEEEQEEQEDKKKKRIKLILTIVLTVLAILLLAYIIGIFYFRNHFTPGTVVNGIDVGFDTEDEAVAAINQGFKNRIVTIIGDKDQTNQVTGQEVDLQFIDITNLENLLRHQDRLTWPFEFLIPKHNDFTSAYHINDDLLKQTVQALSLVSGPNVVKPKDAVFNYNGSNFSINPAVDGNEVNAAKLEKAVEQALVNNTETIRLSRGDFYEKPAVTADSPIMQSNLEKLNTALDAKITINFPDNTITLTKSEFSGWLQANNDGVFVNSDQLNNYVNNLSSQFNTKGRVYSLHAYNNQTVSFANDHGGYVLNNPEMVNRLNSLILQGSTSTIDPIWSESSGAYIAGNQITSNYIEVSLALQMVWVFKNNSLIGSHGCVSGDVATRQTTQTGLYYIRSINQNSTLNIRMPNGTVQNQMVKYWIPYSDLMGFISSTWRDNYGGNIYQNQGTDGDIDIPLDLAQTIASNTGVNYPVIIY